MTDRRFEQLQKRILAKLQNGLNPKLTYHCPEHTLDVIEQAVRIAGEESEQAGHNIRLLKIAALFHDTGFLETYKEHEEVSCRIARRELDGEPFSGPDLDLISGMIMATRIPQSPRNLMEMILADADLDYLGRNDFPEISSKLEKEFMEFGIVKNRYDWEGLQIRFIENHRYFTPSQIRIREPVKQAHLEALKTAYKNNKPGN